MTSKEFSACQKEDPDLGVLIGHLHGSLKSNAKSKVAKQMLRDRKKSRFRNRVLYGERDDYGDTVFQLVLPAKFHLQALQGVRDEVGHMDQEDFIQGDSLCMEWVKLSEIIWEVFWSVYNRRPNSRLLGWFPLQPVSL